MTRQDESWIFDEYFNAMVSMVGSEGKWIQIDSQEGRGFWMIAFDSVPDAESTTAFTFGISSIHHNSWKHGAPELVISVNSRDDDWIYSLGALSSALRGECPFSLGNVLRFGKPLSLESRMTAYFLFWPTILENEQSQVELTDRTINFVQAYPVFESEAALINKVGPETFFMTNGLDLTNVARSPAGVPGSSQQA